MSRLAPGSTSSPTDEKLIVGVADMAVSADPASTIVTFALGSCIGVTIYDPVARVGGLLHFMLPTSDLNKDKAAQNPAMFGDTGIPHLFRTCYERGAKKERLIVCAAGGAETLSEDGHFKIGTRNRTLLRKIFWKNSILLSADDTGGANSRTLSLRIADGLVIAKSQGTERTLWAA
ncbi:MAG: chemotaxis protein CheD [Planctomycetota bacterium]|nr:chemotaxis protein CheD [Planctomycetota bacterium]